MDKENPPQSLLDLLAGSPLAISANLFQPLSQTNQNMIAQGKRISKSHITAKLILRLAVQRGCEQRHASCRIAYHEQPT
jgi:hypothetical protein